MLDLYIIHKASRWCSQSCSQQFTVWGTCLRSGGRSLSCQWEPLSLPSKKYAMETWVCFFKISYFCSPNLHIVQQGFSQPIDKSLSHCFLLLDSLLASWDPQFPAVHPRSLLDFMVWEWPGQASFGEQHGCVPIRGSRTDMGLMEGATFTNSVFEAYTGICMYRAVVEQKSKP